MRRPKNKGIIKNFKAKYFNQNVGDFPDHVSFLDSTYIKIDDLRYGTNPHQPAALYKPDEGLGFIFGQMEVLKTGKNGLSQTNIEDIHMATNILKYFDTPAVAVMKHCNPSGVVQGTESDNLADLYLAARDCDSRAAFGSVVVTNTKVTKEMAEAVMESVVEMVAAVDFEDEAINTFNDSEKFGRNKAIRIVKLPELVYLPRFYGDAHTYSVTFLSDGSMILSEPLLTKIKSKEDMIRAATNDAAKGKIQSIKIPDERMLDDMLFAWYITMHVRSNGVVIVKNRKTLAIGTGEQDRIGAIEQAIWKAKNKYQGAESLDGAILGSDGFLPFSDSVEICKEAGMVGIIQPGGSIRDYEVIESANELGLSMMFTDERCFSHH